MNISILGYIYIDIYIPLSDLLSLPWPSLFIFWPKLHVFHGQLPMFNGSFNSNEAENHGSQGPDPGILLHYSPNLNISQPPEPPARSPAPFHKPARRQRNVPKSRSFGPRRYFGLDKISKHFEPCPVNNMVGCKSNGYAMLCLVLLVLSCFYKHQHGVVEVVIVSYNI